MRDGWHPEFQPAKNRRTRSYQTIKKYIRHIRHIIYFASERGYFEKFNITLPKARRKEVKISLTMDQVDLIDQHLEGKYPDTKDPKSSCVLPLHYAPPCSKWSERTEL
jgi:hypothetical protein